MKQVVEVTTSWNETKQQQTFEIRNGMKDKMKQKCFIFIAAPQTGIEKEFS